MYSPDCLDDVENGERRGRSVWEAIFKSVESEFERRFEFTKPGLECTKVRFGFLRENSYKKIFDAKSVGRNKNSLICAPAS